MDEDDNGKLSIERVKHQDLQIFGNLHTFEAVDRGSETQLKVGEHLKGIT